MPPNLRCNGPTWLEPAYYASKQRRCIRHDPIRVRRLRGVPPCCAVRRRLRSHARVRTQDSLSFGNRHPIRPQVINIPGRTKLRRRPRRARQVLIDEDILRSRGQVHGAIRAIDQRDGKISVGELADPEIRLALHVGVVVGAGALPDAGSGGGGGVLV